MRCGILIAVACSSALILGCGTPKHTAGEFNFVTTNTTLQQIIDRVGPYDRVRGSGVLYYQWNLSDGSAILVATEEPFQQTNKVTGFRVLSGCAQHNSVAMSFDKGKLTGAAAVSGLSF